MRAWSTDRTALVSSGNSIRLFSSVFLVLFSVFVFTCYLYLFLLKQDGRLTRRYSEAGQVSSHFVAE